MHELSGVGSVVTYGAGVLIARTGELMNRFVYIDAGQIEVVLELHMYVDVAERGLKVPT